MSELEGVEYIAEHQNQGRSLLGRNPQASLSMRDMPTSSSPQSRGLRRSASAPMQQYHEPTVYAPPPIPYFPTPVVPVQQTLVQPIVYPAPYSSSYMVQPVYYSPPPPAGVVYRQHPSMVPYPQYDSNFEAYFGPDVRAPQSSLAQQREQFESFERAKPRTQQATRGEGGISLAEAKAVEDAIQLSLSESSRRASRGDHLFGGPGTGTGSGSGDAWDSDHTSLAASSTRHWTEDGVGDSSDAASKADEMALQTAIMLSLTDPTTSGTVATATAGSRLPTEVPSALTSRESSGLSPREESSSREQAIRREATFAGLNSPRTDDEVDSPRCAGYSDSHCPLPLPPPPSVPSPALREVQRRCDDQGPLHPRRAGGRPMPPLQLQRHSSERTTGSYWTPRSDPTGSYTTPRTDRSIVETPRPGSVERGRPPPPPYDPAVAQDSPRRSGPAYPPQRSSSTGRPYPADRFAYEERGGYYRDGGRDAPRGHQRDFGRYPDYRRNEAEYYRRPLEPRKPVHFDHFSSEEARICSAFAAPADERRGGARRTTYTAAYTEPPPLYSPRDENPWRVYDGRSASAPRGGGRAEGGDRDRDDCARGRLHSHGWPASGYARPGR